MLLCVMQTIATTALHHDKMFVMRIMIMYAIRDATRRNKQWSINDFFCVALFVNDIDSTKKNYQFSSY